MSDYKQRIKRTMDAISDAEYIIIGAGAGLSAAAGLTYSGKRFDENFADFRKKYGFTDMYSGSFYPFETPEESWAHWARHISVNRFEMPATELYKSLLGLVKSKDYFVITTNVESQFEKAGFPKDKIFEVQGNYAYLQCAKGCHDKLYYNESLIAEMLAKTVDCKIPSDLVPKCPVCGGSMDVNLRHNDVFVEDENWFAMQARYAAFLEKTKGKHVAFLEFGVGFNTPGIVRFPFEQMTYHNPNATLVRLNRDYPQAIDENKTKTVSFDEDIQRIVCDLLDGRGKSERSNQLYA